MTTYLGKSCSFCLPRVPFVICRQFVYSVISLLVLRAGYGILLYRFLIIAYLFTFQYTPLHSEYTLWHSYLYCQSSLTSVYSNAFWNIHYDTAISLVSHHWLQYTPLNSEIYHKNIANFLQIIKIVLFYSSCIQIVCDWPLLCSIIGKRLSDWQNLQNGQ